MGDFKKIRAADGMGPTKTVVSASWKIRKFLAHYAIGFVLFGAIAAALLYNASGHIRIKPVLLTAFLGATATAPWWRFFWNPRNRRGKDRKPRKKRSTKFTDMSSTTKAITAVGICGIIAALMSFANNLTTVISNIRSWFH